MHFSFLEQMRRDAASRATYTNGPMTMPAVTRNPGNQKLLDKIKMAEQIKNVLPQVPFKTIQQDLGKIKHYGYNLNFDVVGTNFEA